MGSKIYQVRQSSQKFDYILLILIIALVLLGLFTVFSASAYVAELNYKNSMYFFKKQLINAVIGFGAMVMAMRLDFFQLRRSIKTSMIVVSFLLLCTYFSFLGGTVVNGASGWIRFLGFGFQPSEVAKVVLISFTANLLANPEYQELKFMDRLITLIPLVSIIGIVVFEPDIGNTSIISLGVFSIYFTAGLSFTRIFGAIGLGAAAVTFLIFNNPYQMARITGFMDPWADPQGKGFQLIQSLIAIGSGGSTGKGLGQSMQKLFYLPESHTDFIFAVYCEETGLIGSFVFLFLIIAFFSRGMGIAIRSKDNFVKLLVTGLTTMICGQAVMNIGVATGLLPTTGITLPFISFGGTSLIVNLFCMGLILNASMYTSNNWEVLEGKADDNNK